MKIVILFFILAFSLSASGKTDTTSFHKKSAPRYNNAISYAGPSLFRGWKYINRVNLLFIWDGDIGGVSYERRAYKNFFVKIEYSHWLDRKNTDPRLIYFGSPDWTPGTISSAGRFKMIDCQALYAFDISKRHRVALSCGYTQTTGEGERIDSVTVYPGYYDYIVHSSPTKLRYDGIVGGISYDYFMFRNRIRVGVDVFRRHYFNSLYSTKEYGAHIGVNF